MRVLFATLPALGHFYPLVPLARALRAAGHDVLVAVPADFLDEVVAAGLAGVSVSATFDSARTVGVLRTDTWHRGSGAPLGAQPEGRTGLLDVAASTLAGTLRVVENWRPDLVVMEPTARSAQLAAARHGVPVALLPWGMLVPPEVLAAGAGAQWMRPGPLEESLGLTEVPPPVLRIEVCPPGYRYPDPRPVQHMRYEAYNGPVRYPVQLDSPPQRPVACLSFSALPPGLPDVLGAVSDTGLDMVIGVAQRHREAVRRSAAGLVGVCHVGPVPLGAVLPDAVLAVHDGSAGKTMTALVHGTPQLVLPQEGEQFAHAGRVAQVGIGRRLDPAETTLTTLAAAVAALTTDRRYRKTARELATVAAGQPVPAEVADRLTEIVSASAR